MQIVNFLYMETNTSILILLTLGLIIWGINASRQLQSRKKAKLVRVKVTKHERKPHYHNLSELKK